MMHHPLHNAHEKIDHLVDVAERGESPETPAIVVGGVALVVLPLIGLFIAIAAVAAYFLSGGSWPFS
jgi:hypothetical protein